MKSDTKNVLKCIIHINLPFRARGKMQSKLSLDAETAQYCIPNYADILVFQATYSGHFAFRSTVR